MQSRSVFFLITLGCVGAATLCLDTAPAAAEIVNCNGVFTNQPCKNATPVMKELKSSAEQRQAVQQRSAKRSRAQHYALRALKTQRELGVVSDIASVENYCALETTSYESCDDRVRLQEADLDRQAAAVRAQRERERTAEQKREQVDQTTNQQVIVIQNNDLWERRRDWYRPRHDRRDGSRDRPFRGDDWRPNRSEDRPAFSGKPRPGNPPNNPPGLGDGSRQPSPGRNRSGLGGGSLTSGDASSGILSGGS